MPFSHETATVLFEYEVLKRLLCLHTAKEVKHKKYLSSFTVFASNLTKACKSDPVLSVVCQKYVLFEDLMHVLYDMTKAARRRNKDHKPRNSDSTIDDIDKFGGNLIKFLTSLEFKDVVQIVGDEIIEVDIERVDDFIQGFKNTNFSSREFSHHEHIENFCKFHPSFIWRRRNESLVTPSAGAVKNQAEGVGEQHQDEQNQAEGVGERHQDEQNQAPGSSVLPERKRKVLYISFCSNGRGGFQKDKGLYLVDINSVPI